MATRGQVRTLRRLSEARLTLAVLVAVRTLAERRGEEAEEAGDEVRRYLAAPPSVLQALLDAVLLAVEEDKEYLLAESAVRLLLRRGVTVLRPSRGVVNWPWRRGEAHLLGDRGTTLRELHLPAPLNLRCKERFADGVLLSEDAMSEALVAMPALRHVTLHVAVSDTLLQTLAVRMAIIWTRLLLSLISIKLTTRLKLTKIEYRQILSQKRRLPS